MEKIINEIKDFINKKNSNLSQEDIFPKFSEKNHKSFLITKNNFHEIINSNNYQGKNIAFIDGGNLEIINNPDFSLNIIRIYYSIYKDNKKIKSKKTEFFALVYSEETNNEIYYKTKVFSEKREFLPEEKDLIFNSLDNTIKTGTQRINISKIAGIVRRFSELSIASEIIENLDEKDIIVLDGSLQSCITNENNYLENLYAKAKQKGVIISALSKSCNLITNKGTSLIKELDKISPKIKWFYNPIAELQSQNYQAEIFFVKLNKNSKHLFKFEIYNQQKENFKEILNILCNNSKDPVFLGYPYGLIEVDKFARISNNELNYYKTIITSKLGKAVNNINQENAHDILDKIGY